MASAPPSTYAQRVHDDPLGVLRAGAAAERAAETDDDRSLIARARGLAALTMRDGRAARKHLDRALRLATTEHRRDAAAISLAAVDATDGRLDAATSALEAARRRTSPPQRGVATVQLATVLSRRGELSRAAALLHEARKELDSQPDDDTELMFGLTTGLLLVDQGDTTAALSALHDALELATRVGQRARQALICHTIGWTLATRGELPEALAMLDRTRAIRTELGLPTAYVDLERARVLWEVGLLDEAIRSGGDAVAALGDLDAPLTLADAVLEHAEILIDAGRAAAALREATRARALAVAQGRVLQTHLAALIQLRARSTLHGARAEDVRDARRHATALHDTGATLAAHAATLTAAEIALDVDVDTAADLLSQLRSPATTRTFRIEMHELWLHAELARRRGDTDRARTSIDMGMLALRRHRTQLGSSAWRAASGTHARGLIEMGTRLAADSPVELRAFVHGVRAGAWSIRSPRHDDDTLERIATLRRQAGTQPFRPGGQPAPTLPEIEQEAAHPDGARDSTSPGRWAVPRTPDATTPIELTVVVDRGRVLTVVHTGSACELHDVGAVGSVVAEIEQLRFAMRRLVRTTAHAGRSRVERHRRAAADAAATLAAERLTVLLTGLEGEDLLGRGLTVSAPGRFHALPWAVLPPLDGVAVQLHAGTGADREQHGPTRRTLLAAGPGLEHSTSELDAIEAIVPDARRLDRTTTTELLEELEHADIAHIACHGTFRADSPEFSTLQLHDGPLFAHDIVRVARTPEVVVMTACDSAQSMEHIGGGMRGIAATMLERGTSSFLGSVLPIGDATAAVLGRTLHAGLGAGRSPARALASAHAAVPRWERTMTCTGVPR